MYSPKHALLYSINILDGEIEKLAMLQLFIATTKIIFSKSLFDSPLVSYFCSYFLCCISPIDIHRNRRILKPSPCEELLANFQLAFGEKSEIKILQFYLLTHHSLKLNISDLRVMVSMVFGANDKT
jgi:hypothetical protein